MTYASTSLLRLAFGAAVMAIAAAAPVGAQAWWRGGVFIGVPPVVVAPPIYPAPYYYPPAYYPGYYPPPYPYPAPQGYAAPQGQQPAQTQSPELSQNSAPHGETCYAGIYVCGAPPQSHVGTGCACPGLGAPSYGVVQ